MAPTSTTSSISERFAARKHERDRKPVFEALKSRILVARLEGLLIDTAVNTNTAAAKAAEKKAELKLPLKERIDKSITKQKGVEYRRTLSTKAEKTCRRFYSIDALSAVRGSGGGVAKKSPRTKGRRVLTILGEKRKKAALEPILGKRGREEMEMDDFGSGREERGRLIKKCRDNGWVKNERIAKWMANMPEAESMMGGMGLEEEDGGCKGWSESLPLLSMTPWEREVMGKKEVYKKPAKISQRFRRISKKGPSYTTKPLEAATLTS